MSIPLVTTHVTVRGVRSATPIDLDADGFDAPSPTPAILISGLNACISGPTAVQEGGAEVDMWNLRTDRFDIRRGDTITDETTGDVYVVSTVTHSKIALYGLDHTHALIKMNKGLPDVHSTAS